jgi:hypothetical protein
VQPEQEVPEPERPDQEAPEQEVVSRRQRGDESASVSLQASEKAGEARSQGEPTSMAMAPHRP